MANDDTTDSDEVTVAPISASPAAVTREVMRAMADKMSVSLRMQSGLIDHAIGDMMAGLYAGRFEVFLETFNRVREATEAIRVELEDSKKNIDTIKRFDPTYAEAIDVVAQDIVFRVYRPIVRQMSLMDLATDYAIHLAGCTEHDRCGHVRAFRAEFKRRKMSPPEIMQGGAR